MEINTGIISDKIYLKYEYVNPGTYDFEIEIGENLLKGDCIVSATSSGIEYSICDCTLLDADGDVMAFHFIGAEWEEVH